MFGRMSDSTKAIIFFLIATALCAAAVALTPALGEDALKVAMFTPLLAVLAMMLIVTRDGYAPMRWLELGVHRPGLRGWGLAILVPLIVLGAAYGIVWGMGLARFEAPAGSNSPAYALDIVVSIFIVAVMGGIGEEIGWRGYLLPRLLKFGARKACLIVGFLHGLFHLPAILWTPFYHGDGDLRLVIPLFLATLTLAGVCYGFLRIWTRSVWPAALAHSAFNIFWDRLNASTHASDPMVLEYLAGESGVLTLGALAIVAAVLLWRMPRAGDRH